MVLETPTTTTSQKSIAIHLFILQYASKLYCSAFGVPTLWGKGNTVSTPPICIAGCPPFALQYASHLYRSTFGKILVVVVTEMFSTTFAGRNWNLQATLKFSSKNQARKKGTNPNIWVRIFSGGVGVFHTKGWGPRSSVCPSKPGKSNFLGGISRDFAGISRRCPKSLRKKKFPWGPKAH